MMPYSPFKIGNCQVIPAEFSLQIEGEQKQSLQPKFIEVLCYLARHHPRIIPRAELIDNIWGHDSYVGDKSLTNAIWHLRKSLALLNGEEEVIETIRKAGYRLLLAPQWQNDAVGNDRVKNSSNDSVNSQLPQAPLNQVFSQKRSQTILALTITLVALALVLTYFYYNKDEVKQEIIRQITQHPGSELFPAPSPDGRYIAYSQISINKPNNIFLQDTSQPQLPAKQLTFDQALEGHSVWSNDGQYLYFSRKDKINNTCKYIQLKVQSRQEKELANCPMKGGYYYLDISPNDQTLAVYAYNKGDKQTGIYFINLEKQNSKLIRFSCINNCGYKDRDMAFSPDGKFIAVTRRLNRFNENIFLVNLTDKSSEQLTFNEEDIVGLSWHPDGKKIVYATQRAGIRNGFVFDVETKTNQALKLPGFSYPSFAKKSKELYYQQREQSYYIASLQLNSEIALSPFPVMQSTFNHHSPDYNSMVKRIVYVSNESGFNELWSSSPNGDKRQQLTHLKKNIRYPKWSHAGDKIAFLTANNNEKKDSIYIYSLINQKLTILSSPFLTHNRPSWSWNDNEIITAIYGDKFTDLFSIDTVNGKAIRLTYDGGRYGVMKSASSLVYTKLKRGLWQKELATTGAERSSINTAKNKHQKPINIIDGKSFTTLYAWSYNNAQVYFHKSLDDHQQIIAYHIDTKVIEPLIRLPANSFSDSDTFTYIPEQEKLLYTATSFPQANIKMIANSPLFQ